MALDAHRLASALEPYKADPDPRVHSTAYRLAIALRDFALGDRRTLPRRCRQRSRPRLRRARYRRGRDPSPAGWRGASADVPAHPSNYRYL